jgi:restriction endonuclease Mrr
MASSNGEVRIGAVADSVAEQLGLTPEERAELFPSGKQTIFSNRVHWAKTGLIESTRRAHFKITSRGQEVLKSHPAPASTTPSLVSSMNFSNSEKNRLKERPKVSNRQPPYLRAKELHPTKLCAWRIGKLRSR